MKPTRARRSAAIGTGHNQVTSLTGRKMSQPKQPMQIRPGQHWSVCPYCQHRVVVVHPKWNDVESGIGMRDWVYVNHDHDGARINRNRLTPCRGSLSKAPKHLVFEELKP